MTTKELEKIVNDWDPNDWDPKKHSNSTLEFFVAQIAYQLSRRNDLYEEQFKYNMDQDVADGEERKVRDSLLTQMKDTVKTGLESINPTPIYKRGYRDIEIEKENKPE